MDITMIHMGMGIIMIHMTHRIQLNLHSSKCALMVKRLINSFPMKIILSRANLALEGMSNVNHLVSIEFLYAGI